MSSAIAEPVTAHEQEDEEEDQYQDYLRAPPTLSLRRWRREGLRPAAAGREARPQA